MENGTNVNAAIKLLQNRHVLLFLSIPEEVLCWIQGLTFRSHNCSTSPKDHQREDKN